MKSARSKQSASSSASRNTELTLRKTKTKPPPPAAAAAAAAAAGAVETKVETAPAPVETATTTVAAAGATAVAGVSSLPSPAAAAAAAVGARGRLSSIRQQRDLNLTAALKRPATLLAARGTRKVFVPVLNGQRYRDTQLTAAAAAVNNNNSDSGRGRHNRSGQRGGGHGKERGRGDRSRGGRGQGREGQFIQTSGTAFSEGIAACNKPRAGALGGSGGGGGGGAGGGEAAAPAMPVFTGVKRVDKEEEERKLASLMRDNFIDDCGAECDESMTPVRLPLTEPASVSASASSTTLSSQSLKVKVKTEPGLECGGDGPATVAPSGVKSDNKPADTVFKTLGQESSLADIFLNGCGATAADGDISERLLFFQFPDTLPVMSNSDSPPPPPSDVIKDGGAHASRSNDSQKQQQHSDQSQSPELVSVSDMCDGTRLGSVQVLKSGTVRLLIGSHVLLLESGIDVKFLQDVVSVSTGDSDNGTGGSHSVHNDNIDGATIDNKEGATICVLGQVSNRIVCSPDWQTMLSS